MAKERRSLSAALSLTPEAIAFIGKPDAQVQAKDVLAARPIEVEAVGQGDSTETAVEIQKETRSQTRSRRATTKQSDQEIPFGMANLLVPLTTRLRPQVAAALKRAGLEQKLRGASPSTVQEIVDEAIETWLQKHDYLA